MKAAWRAVAILTLLIAGAQAQPAPASAPQTLALAQRYTAATGGTYELFQEQAYGAAQAIGDTPAAHAWQQALQAAALQHRADLAALDARFAALIADSCSAQELTTAVDFVESPAGRAIVQKRTAYFAAPFAPNRPDPPLTADEAAAFGAYDATAQAAALKAKMPAVLARMQALALPVQKAILKSARASYCHASRKCLDGESNYDQLAGPTLREPL